jgi:hypothetical protein
MKSRNNNNYNFLSSDNSSDMENAFKQGQMIRLGLQGIAGATESAATKLREELDKRKKEKEDKPKQKDKEEDKPNGKEKPKKQEDEKSKVKRSCTCNCHGD